MQQLCYLSKTPSNATVKAESVTNWEGQVAVDRPVKTILYNPLDIQLQNVMESWLHANHSFQSWR